MKNIFLLILFYFSFFLFTMAADGKKDWKKVADNPAFLHRSIKEVTDVIVYDVFSPPVASRIYAYITVAAYEASRREKNNYLSLAGQLQQLQEVQAPEGGRQVNYSLAAVHALLMVAKSMVISEQRIQEFNNKMMIEYKRTGMPAEVFDNSIVYGEKVAAHIIAWSAKDNYRQSRSFPKYTVIEDSTTWKPTAPAYMKAIEPHWSRIRTFLLDSAQQFKPHPATSFSVDKNSQFYKEAMEVYTIAGNLNDEQIAIANFWDCNPFKMNVNGHVMFATKKISPGGHWINITAMACKKNNADLVRSAEAYACLSVTLADAFISCWDEKYRSRVIRPETYIGMYINPDWMPLLQTPPFPEYTSGHSVVSAASSVILGRLFGENFSYLDSTEVEFGIPARSFTSFQQAAEEAAISRLYGGIHYMSAIRNGLEEGNKLAVYIISRLKTRKD
jgi:hypothetical protein